MDVTVDAGKSDEGTSVGSACTEAGVSGLWKGLWWEPSFPDTECSWSSIPELAATMVSPSRRNPPSRDINSSRSGRCKEGIKATRDEDARRALRAKDITACGQHEEIDMRRNISCWTVYLPIRVWPGSLSPILISLRDMDGSKGESFLKQNSLSGNTVILSARQ